MGTPPMKTYAVAVVANTVVEGKRWYSATTERTGLGLYFIDAPDDETAKALGAHQALQWLKYQEPGGKTSIVSILARDLPQSISLPQTAAAASSSQVADSGA